MGIPVIVMGAAGRMGATMVRLVEESADLNLAGAVDRFDRLSALASLPCPVAQNASELPAAVSGAVIVDFTAPGVSLSTAREAARTGAAHVIGTTGFSGEEQAELRELAARTPIFWSPNMSVGVNALLRILPELARLLGDSYDLEMTEIHHNKKKDAPSGTALRLAEALADARDWPFSEVACCRREGIIGERPVREIGIQSLRGGDVVGVHTVYFLGLGERIELTHQAHSRENFASGALRAIRFLHGQKAGKLYGMQDILQ